MSRTMPLFTFVHRVLVDAEIVRGRAPWAHAQAGARFVACWHSVPAPFCVPPIGRSGRPRLRGRGGGACRRGDHSDGWAFRYPEAGRVSSAPGHRRGGGNGAVDWFRHTKVRAVPPYVAIGPCVASPR